MRFLRSLPAIAPLVAAAWLLPAAADPAGDLATRDDLAPIQVFDRIGAIEAWPHGRGAGIVVAVVDSGVAMQHPELNGRVAINVAEAAGVAGVDDDNNGYVDDLLGWDFIDGDNIPWVIANDPAAGNGRDDDGDGRVDGGVSHGTYAAGIIAGQNTGVASESRILPVRVVDDEGAGSPALLAAGIDYARKRGAVVIYVGVGFPQDDTNVRAAIDRAMAAGALVVAPVGNNTIDIRYPAAYGPVLAVGSFDDGRPAPYSAWGAAVDIAAPGTRLYAPRVAPVSGELGYARVTGTSYSAALVAGAAALLRGAAPTLTAEATAQYLISAADPLPLGDGVGALSIGRAVRLALGR